MTTFYVDPIGGNDASAGTSFATRWKTLTSGATEARIAPNDTIRIMASPDATSMSQNATWIENSDTVTMASSVTADIEQATTAWTAMTNVTTTTNASRKIGATSSSIAIAAGFTTGKAAYKTISATDFSAYQQVSFWIKMSVWLSTMANDGDITLRLCSDTTGDVTVNTISVPRIRLSYSAWQAYTIDLGTALGSSIQSIALYVAVDNAAQTFLINNILACKASSSADSLSLTSRISKNTGNEDWYHLQSISGTSLVLETFGITNDKNTNSDVRPKYAGTTETVTLYKREPFQLASTLVNPGNDSTSLWGQIMDSGTSGSPITFSGGWNSTDMSTQTGDTFMSGVNGAGHGITCTDISYVTFDKLNFSRFYMGIKYIRSSATCNNIIYTAKTLSANTNCAIRLGQGDIVEVVTDCTFNIDNLNCNGGANGLQAVIHDSQACIKRNTFNIVNMNSNYAYLIFMQGIGIQSRVSTGVQSVGNTFNITNMKRNGYIGQPSNFIQSAAGNTFNVTNYLHSGNSATLYAWYFITSSGNGIQGPAYNKLKISGSLTGPGSGTTVGIFLGASDNNTLDFTGATISGWDIAVGNFTNSASNKIIGGTFSSNTTTDIACFGVGNITTVGTTLSSTTKTLFSTDNVLGYASINAQKYGGTSTDHRNFFQGGTINSDATTRHTASGISWKMSPTSTSYVTATYPLVLPLGQFAVNANSLVTATVWVNRTNTGLAATLRVPGGQLSGVSADVTATASGSASSWEQLSLTFTPTEAGIMSLQMEAYGGTTYSVYVDDISITQA